MHTLGLPSVLRPPALLFVFAAAATPACSAFHDDARELLARGRPIEALEHLREQEPAARRWERCRFARYALDRGVTHLALGDVGEGGTWIARAEEGEARSPGCLDYGDRGRLASAVRALPAR